MYQLSSEDTLSHKQEIDQSQLYKWQIHGDSFSTSAIEAPHKMVISSSSQRNLHLCNKIYWQSYLLSIKIFFYSAHIQHFYELVTF